MNFQSLFPPLLTAPCLALFNADLGKKKRGAGVEREGARKTERERERDGGGGGGGGGWVVGKNPFLEFFFFFFFFS